MSFWDSEPNRLVVDFNNKPDSYLASGSFMRAFSGIHVRNLMDAIKNDPYIEKVKDPKIGGPKLHGKISQSTARSILYIREIEKYFDPNKIKWLTDFGAGYGNFVRVWHRLFETDFYQLVDLEPLHQIQQSYLNAQGIHANWRTHNSQLKPSGQSGPSLFFASHSLNECSMEVRDVVEEYLPLYDYIYISYNEDFDGINNVDYFKQLGGRLETKFTVEHTFDKVTGKRRLIAK